MKDYGIGTTMKVGLLVVAVLIVFLALAWNATTIAQGIACYREQGGTTIKVGSGCTLTVMSGGIFDVASGGAFKIAGTSVTATAAELNAVAGTGLSATELAFLDGVTAGTVAAGKAVVTTTDKHIDALVISASGLAIGAGAGTVVTATGTELNTVAGITPGTVLAGKAIVTTTDKHIDTIVISDGGLKLGAGAGTAVARTAAEINLLAQGLTAGVKVKGGATALDGSNPTTVVTGLATIVACTATMQTAIAPGLGTSTVTVDFGGGVTAGSVELHGWKPTGAGDTTLIASTGTETIAWTCIGT